MDCKKDKQVRHGYGEYKFENLDSLPDNKVLIDKYRKNTFSDFYYNPENQKFYIKSKNKNGEKYVERRVDKDGRIHLKNNDDKYVHVKYEPLIKYINNLLENYKKIDEKK